MKRTREEAKKTTQQITNEQDERGDDATEGEQEEQGSEINYDEEKELDPEEIEQEGREQAVIEQYLTDLGVDLNASLDEDKKSAREVYLALIQGTDDAVNKALDELPKNKKVDKWLLQSWISAAELRIPKNDQIVARVNGLRNNSSSTKLNTQLDTSLAQPDMPGASITQEPPTSALDATDWVMRLYDVVLDLDNPSRITKLLDQLEQLPSNPQFSDSHKSNLKGLAESHTPEVQQRISALCQGRLPTRTTTTSITSSSSKSTNAESPGKDISASPHPPTVAQVLPPRRPIVLSTDSKATFKSVVGAPSINENNLPRDTDSTSAIQADYPYFPTSNITLADESEITQLVNSLITNGDTGGILRDWEANNRKVPIKDQEAIRDLLPFCSPPVQNKILSRFETRVSSHKAHMTEEREVKRQQPTKQTPPLMSKIEKKLYEALAQEQYLVVTGLLKDHGIEINFTCAKGKLIETALEMADEKERLGFINYWLDLDKGPASNWHVAVLVKAVKKKDMPLIEVLIKDGRALEADKEHISLVTAIKNVWEIGIVEKLITVPKYQQDLDIHPLLFNAEDAEAFDIADYLNRIIEECGVTPKGAVADTSKIASIPKFRPEVEALKNALAVGDEEATKRWQRELWDKLDGDHHLLLLNLATPYNNEVAANFIRDMLLEYEISTRCINLALINATSFGNTKGVVALLKHEHADSTNGEIIPGRTALSLAVRHQFVDILKVFLEHIEEAGKVNEIDYYALIAIAKTHNNPDILKLLALYELTEEPEVSDDIKSDVGMSAPKTYESQLVAEEIAESSAFSQYERVKVLFASNKGNINLSHPLLIENILATEQNDVIECLLNELKCKQHAQEVYNTVFIRAAGHGNHKIVTSFFTMPQFLNMDYHTKVQALAEAVENKHPQTVEVLVLLLDITKYIGRQLLLNHIPKEEDKQALAIRQIIYQVPQDNWADMEAVREKSSPLLIKALVKNNEKELFDLMHSHDCALDWNNGKVLLVATSVGGTRASNFINRCMELPFKLGAKMFLECLKTAIRHRHLDLYTTLLSLAQSLPSDQMYRVALEAARLGELESLKLMMELPKVKAHITNNQINLVKLGYYGARHNKVTEYIKGLSGQNTTSANTSTPPNNAENALYQAIYKRDNEEIRNLLQSDIAFPYEDYLILREACAFRVDTTKEILQRYYGYPVPQTQEERDKRCAISASIAAGCGHTLILSWLFTSKLLPPTYNKATLYVNAVIGNHLNTILFLALEGSKKEQNELLEYMPERFKPQITEFIKVTDECLANGMDKSLLLSLLESLKQVALLRQVCKAPLYQSAIIIVIEHSPDINNTRYQDQLIQSFTPSKDVAYQTQPAKLIYEFRRGWVENIKTEKETNTKIDPGLPQ